MWWQQFVKEARGNRLELLLLAGLLIVWSAFLYSRVGVWPSAIIVGLYWLPASFLPLWAIWTSVQLYRQEWRENTSYLMLSLPVRAWTITSAKLAFVAAGLAGYSALAAGGAWLLTARMRALEEPLLTEFFGIVPFDWFISTAALAWGSGLLAVMMMSVVTQAAYVFSRLFNRLQALVMVWAWLIFAWVLVRAASIGGWLLAWLPGIRIRTPHVVHDVSGFHTVTIESGPLAAAILAALALYWLLNVTLERAVEV